MTGGHGRTRKPSAARRVRKTNWHLFLPQRQEQIHMGFTRRRAAAAYGFTLTGEAVYGGGVLPFIFGSNRYFSGTSST